MRFRVDVSVCHNFSFVDFIDGVRAPVKENKTIVSVLVLFPFLDFFLAYCTIVK